MALDLSQQERYALAALVESDGYKVLLDIMEGQCEVRETELIRLGPETSSDTVLRKHAEVRAGRLLFESIQSEVNYQVGEVRNG